MAKTNKEKLNDRYSELNAVALRLGFETWSKYSTEVLQASKANRVFAEKNYPGTGQVTLCFAPRSSALPESSPPQPADAQAVIRYPACGHIRYVGGPSDTGGDKCHDCAIDDVVTANYDRARTGP